MKFAPVTQISTSSWISQQAPLDLLFVHGVVLTSDSLNSLEEHICHTLSAAAAKAMDMKFVPLHMDLTTTSPTLSPFRSLFFASVVRCHASHGYIC